MKKFLVLWVSHAFSLLGSAIVQFALAWYLTRETGSATVLATAIMVSLIPSIVLGPFIGPLIDRWDRKKIMIFADLAVTLLTIVLVILFYTKTIQVWHIYVVMIGRSVGETFEFPALAASIPMIVPEKHLTRANGLYQTLQNAVRIIAPPAGAFLMEYLPMQEVFAVDIVTAVIAVSCLLLLHIPQPVRTTLTLKLDYFGDMKQGFHYIWSRRGLAMLMGLVAVLMFFSFPAGSLIPVLVNQHLAGDVLKLAWLTSAAGIGGIIAGSVIGVWGGMKRKMLMALLGFSIMVPCSIVIGFTSVDLFYATIAAMLFLGVGNTFVNAPLSAILNSVIAKDMQGRVFSLYSSVLMAAMLLGLLAAGPVADSLDIRSIYWIAAGAWLVIIPLAVLNKSLMDLENQTVKKQPGTEAI